METRIVVTGILKDNDLFLIVKRNENDDLYPGAWEFPGGHLETGESLKDGLKRELNEEIGFRDDVIYEYLNGNKKDLIKLNHIESSEALKVFDEFSKNKDKTMY